MKLLLGFEGQRSEWRVYQDVVSFILYDYRTLPILLGAEYLLPAGIARTFSAAHEPDFYSTLSQSGLSRVDVSSALPNVPSVFVQPYLGKGIPSCFPCVVRLVAVNRRERYLFAAKEEAGQFVSCVYGDRNFEAFVRSLF
jgi:hypothetical protein